MTSLAPKVRSRILVTLSVFALAGCATSGNPKDPIEGFNRAMFAFNEGLDTLVIKPVATGYDAVLPSPIQLGVSNVFGNISDFFIGVNNLLQGKMSDGLGDFGRVAINSTIGLLGVFDLASEMGIEKHNEDFGQTFGRWGVGDGAYVVLPVFGPRTVRDTFGLVLDVKTDPVSNVDHVSTRNATQALRLISDRADRLSADRVIDEAALDKYSYIRGAYLQRRRNLIYDGQAPRDFDED
jgi:phospholipid-binding lipoprotein MlaA